LKEDRETKEVEENIIERMDSLAERVSDEIQADLQKKKELQEKIEEAKRSGDDDEAERLLALL
jgi:hypothetical protein